MTARNRISKRAEKVLGIEDQQKELGQEEGQKNIALVQSNQEKPDKDMTPILQSFKLPSYIVYALEDEKLLRRKAQRSDFEKTAIIIEAIQKLLNL